MYEKETKEEGSKKSNLLFISIIAILILVAVGILAWFNRERVLDKGIVDEFTQEDLLEGTIYLTLSSLEKGIPNIYTLDLETMLLEEYFPESPYRNYMSKLTSTGGSMVFVRGYEDNTHQLVLYNIVEDETYELTKRESVFPRNPVFSPEDDRIAFWVYRDVDAPIGEFPEDHSIYILSAADAEMEEVANGVFPLFSPDGGYLLYLKNDGFYTLNLETKEERRAINLDILYLDNYIDSEEEGFEELAETGLPGWTTFRFTLSPSGKDLIVTDTVVSRIGAFEINSWDVFEYEIVSEFPFRSPNWPVFHPGGKHFVVQEFEEALFPEITIYSYYSIEDDDFPFQTIFPLGQEFDVEAIWISDWTY